MKQTAFGRNVSREKQRVDKINAAFDKTCSQRQRSRHARRKMEHHTPQNKAMMLAGHKSAPFFLESCFLNTGNYGIQRGGVRMSTRDNVKERTQQGMFEKRAMAAGEADQQIQHQSSDRLVRSRLFNQNCRTSACRCPPCSNHPWPHICSARRVVCESQLPLRSRWNDPGTLLRLFALRFPNGSCHRSCQRCMS